MPVDEQALEDMLKKRQAEVAGQPLPASAGNGKHKLVDESSEFEVYERKKDPRKEMELDEDTILNLRAAGKPIPPQGVRSEPVQQAPIREPARPEPVQAPPYTPQPVQPPAPREQARDAIRNHPNFELETYERKVTPPTKPTPSGNYEEFSKPKPSPVSELELDGWDSVEDHTPSVPSMFGGLEFEPSESSFIPEPPRAEPIRAEPPRVEPAPFVPEPIFVQQMDFEPTPHHPGNLQVNGKGLRFAIVQAVFNQDITDAMLLSACNKIDELGAELAYHVQVSGVYDLPLACKRLAKRKDVDAIVAIGCVIKGQTKHDEVITHACAIQLSAISCETDTPITLGVIGPGMTREQAEARIGNAAHAVEAAAQLATILA